MRLIKSTLTPLSSPIALSSKGIYVFLKTYLFYVTLDIIKLIVKKRSTEVLTKSMLPFIVQSQEKFENCVFIWVIYSNVPNKRECTVISSKVCVLTFIEPKRQTLLEINMHARLFGTLEYPLFEVALSEVKVLLPLDWNPMVFKLTFNCDYCVFVKGWVNTILVMQIEDKYKINFGILMKLKFGIRDIHIECSKQFEWKLYFYRSGQSGPFWAELKLP